MRDDQSRRPLRIALVFPPAMPPASPPLGIAALKSYMEKGAAVEVRNFDLNLAYFEQAFQWLGDGRLRMRIQKMDYETTAKKAAEARSFFCGKAGTQYFFDLASYNGHAGVYSGFSSVLNGLFDNFARKIILGLPAPPLVTRFFSELVEPLIAFRPELIGFSILFSQQIFFALALAKLCKGGGEPQQPDPALAKSPRAFRAKIVFGGATFSVMPDPGRLLAGPVPVYHGGELREVDTGRLIDYLIVGEGEAALESVTGLLATDNGQDACGPVSSPCSVPGLLHMVDGKLERNLPGAPLDLNTLPLPDFSDFSLDKYHSPLPVLPYLASRGCPWRRCAFCTHQKTYLDYREEDAANTSERLSALHERYGVRHFCLVDEMVHPRRMDRIAGDLIAKRAHVYFSAYARPSGFSGKMLEKAHRAGLRLVMWGLESASQRLLDLMCKGTTAQKIPAILNAAREAGIWNLLFLIFGFPTETKAEWLGTLDFLGSIHDSVHALSRSRFILLEGSPVFCNPQRYGIKRIIDRPQRDPVSIAYDYEVTEGLTQEEAAAMFQESLARLSGLGRSPWFGQFREHMLLFASERNDKKI
jgi:anaerobic magnesium-protoporphyrin IX monomethyl ester cyclase